MDLRSSREGAGYSAPAQTVPLLPDLDEPGFWQRHRALRWVLPLMVLGVVAAGSTRLIDSGGGQGSLPRTTPAALLAAVRAPTNNITYSGTVVSRLSDDLPQLAVPGAADGALTGSHTMKVWYGGPQQQRVAVLAATTETDVFRDGRDVWHWNLADKQAVHGRLTADTVPDGPVPTSGDPLGLTPQALAAHALGAVDGSTAVVLGPSHVVADRRAYDLVITPTESSTLVGSVRISVDGEHKVPLGVQIFARGEDTPAIDVAFTGISFRAPDPANFRFAPPDGVTVEQLSTAADLVSGSGWTTVHRYRAPDVPLADRAPSEAAFMAVSGTWGTGRLFQCDLLCMLVTEDGTVYIGTVEPQELYAAVRQR